MIIVQLGARGLSIKRTRLYGDTPYRMISVRFLIGEAHWVRDPRAEALIRLIVAIARDLEVRP